MKLKTWNDLGFWKTPEWRELWKGVTTPTAGFSPSPQRLFHNLLLCPPTSVKCILLTGEPYSDPNIATGLGYSCNLPYAKCPKETQALLQEYQDDTRNPRPKSGNLVAWAKRGVLLMSTVWTVEEGEPGSHKDLNWHLLTTEILQRVKETNPNTVYLLCGPAAFVASAPVRGIHRVITGTPGGQDKPLFAGSRPFTKVNALLANSGQEIIDWTLPYSKG